jgi:ankyrin repeat protein
VFLPVKDAPMTDQPNDAAQALSQDAINAFVIVSHYDLEKVQAQLAENPALLNENAEWLETPIQAAAHVGRRDIAEFLLAQGAPLDICTAAMLGRFDEIKAMLTDDPDMIDDVGAHHIPLLYYPVIAGHADIAAYLVEHGAAINGDEGARANTPLHGAALFNQPGLARWLLDHDANPYAEDFEGKTPLDRALERDATEIVAMLTPFFDADHDGKIDP